MARNEEKAMGLFNKWTTMKQEAAFSDSRRPFAGKKVSNICSVHNVCN